jgi:type I restriction enzyme, S subunit
MQKVPLSEVCDYSLASTPVNSLNLSNYITTDNLLPNHGGIVDATNLPPARTCPRFEKENILLSNIRPYFKKIWFATFDGGCSTDVLVLKCKNDKYHPKFVYYSLFQDLFFRHMMNGAKGSKMPRGDKDQIMEFQIPDLDEPEQVRIAEILSAIDDKISLNTRINAELEQLARTIYNYWFMQFDFPISAALAASMGDTEIEGKPYRSSGGEMVWNEELKREVPRGWKTGRLGDKVNTSNDSVNPQNFPVKAFKHYSIPVFDATGAYGIEQGSTINSNKFIVTQYDILVSKLNPWFSRVVYAEDENDVICSTEFVIWRPDNENLKNFLFMVARDPAFISYCTQNSTGTSNSHKRVNPDVMMNYLLPYNEDIIIKFGMRINEILKTMLNNKKQNQELTRLRDFLLPLLMSGEASISAE